MVVALTWWGWSGLLATVGAILALWARYAWRAAVRDELIAYLAHAAPEIAVTDVSVGGIVYRTHDADTARRFALGECYRRLAAYSGGTAEAEAARLDVFAGVVLSMRILAYREPAAAAADDGFRRAS